MIFHFFGAHLMTLAVAQIMQRGNVDN